MSRVTEPRPKRCVPRHVLMFGTRFAAPIQAGTKTQTIRCKRIRPIRVGDTLDLREWSGKPYHSPQRRIVAPVTCVRVETVTWDLAAAIQRWIRVEDRWLTVEDLDPFARRDGFADRDMWVGYQLERDRVKFTGMLYSWA